MNRACITFAVVTTLLTMSPLVAAADKAVAAAPVAAIAAVEKGLAAIYADTPAGHKTASGERYDPTRLTAAHRSLPFGTELMVSNAKSHKSVFVRVNDRAATAADGRILKLSPAAARALGMRGAGSAEVSIEVVSPPAKTRKG